MLGGMRYAQKFFRINFKFYKFLLGRSAQNLSKIILKIFHCPCLEGCATRRNSSELTSNFTNFFFGRSAQNLSKIVLKIFHSPARLVRSLSSKIFKKKFRNMRFIW